MGGDGIGRDGGGRGRAGGSGCERTGAWGWGLCVRSIYNFFRCRAYVMDVLQPTLVRFPLAMRSLWQLCPSQQLGPGGPEPNTRWTRTTQNDTPMYHSYSYVFCFAWVTYTSYTFTFTFTAAGPISRTTRTCRLQRRPLVGTWIAGQNVNASIRPMTRTKRHALTSSNCSLAWEQIVNACADFSALLASPPLPSPPAGVPWRGCMSRRQAPLELGMADAYGHEDDRAKFSQAEVDAKIKER